MIHASIERFGLTMVSATASLNFWRQNTTDKVARAVVVLANADVITRGGMAVDVTGGLLARQVRSSPVTSS